MEKLAVLFLLSLYVALAMGQANAAEPYLFNTDKTYVKLEAMGSMMCSKQMNIGADANKISAMLMKMEQLLTNGTLEKMENLTGVMYNATTLNPVDVTKAMAGAAAKRVIVKSGAINSGILSFTFDVYTESANISIDGEVTPVVSGDLGITIKFANYMFTKNDNKLKLTLKIMGSATPTEITSDKGTDGKAYTLGGNGVVRVSQKGGMTTASGNMFTTTFAKGISLEYRIFFKLADVGTSSGDGGNGSNSSTAVTFLGLVVMVVVTLLHTLC